MAKHTLILDTNVIVDAKYRFHGPTWKLVFALMRMGEVRLIVPETVIRETVGDHRRHVSDIRKKSERAGLDTSGLDDEIAGFEGELRAKLAVAEVPTEPSLSLLELVDDAVNRVAPFNANGNGFRDAIIWAHVREAVDKYGDVAFFTGDNGFLVGGDEPKLKPELLKDLTGKVVPFKTIDAWVATIDLGDSSSHIRTSAAESMAQENERLASLVATALKSTPVVVRNRDYLDVEVTAVEVEGPVALVALKRAPSEGGSDNHLAVFRAAVKFTLDTPGDGGDATSWTTRPLDVTGTMSYDPQADGFGDPEFEVVEVPPPRRVGSIGPVVNVADMDAVIRVMSEVSRVTQKQWESPGISAAIESFSGALGKWKEQQFEAIRFAAESISKGLPDTAFPAMKSIFPELEGGVSEPDNDDEPDEPDESDES